MDYHRTFANINGEQLSCTYIPLTKRESWEIEYSAIGTITTALSNSAEHILPLFGQAKKSQDAFFQGTAHIAKAIAAVHQSVPFDVLHMVASKILRGAVIQRPDKSAVIDDLDEADFFDDHLDELLLATFWGLDVSYPRTFSKARAFLVGLFEKAPGETTSKESSTASTQEKPSSSPSPDITG